MEDHLILGGSKNALIKQKDVIVAPKKSFYEITPLQNDPKQRWEGIRVVLGLCSVVSRVAV